jgi:hypothetical protein
MSSCPTLLLPEQYWQKTKSTTRVFDNQERVAELQLKQVKALRYPTIRRAILSLIVNLVLALPQSTSRGLNYGFSASLNLFDGFAQNRNEKLQASK